MANSVARAGQPNTAIEFACRCPPLWSIRTQRPSRSSRLVSPRARLRPHRLVINIDPSADVEPQILRAVYQKANPSVVKIVSLGVAPTADEGQDLLPQGQGSGFVWDADGYIVTNAHVVEGTDTVQVIFADDRSVTGTVLGADAFSDLAVIEIDPRGWT